MLLIDFAPEGKIRATVECPVNHKTAIISDGNHIFYFIKTNNYNLAVVYFIIFKTN